MSATVEFAGFFVAHAVWSVSDGEPLVPLLASEADDGQRVVNRIVNERQLEKAVEKGQQLFAENADDAARLVLIYDGYVTLDSGRTDALFINATSHRPSNESIQMVVPYRNAADANGFAVFRPKVLSVEGMTLESRAFNVAFFRGVDGHEKGAAVWSQYLDQSR